jgi:hypothetical protein
MKLGGASELITRRCCTTALYARQGRIAMPALTGGGWLALAFDDLLLPEPARFMIHTSGPGHAFFPFCTF